MRWWQALIFTGAFLMSSLTLGEAKPKREIKVKTNGASPGSLRMCFYMGKKYAKDNRKEGLSSFITDIDKFIGYGGYYIEKEEPESVFYYLNKAKDYLEEKTEGNWVKASKMILDNIYIEYYLKLFEKTNSKTYLNSARASLEELFNEYDKKYPKIRERWPKSAIKTIEDEKQRAFENLAVLEFLDQ